MIRHLSLPLVASLINNLRCHDRILCVLLLIQSDVHNLRTLMAVEYISTMVAFIEPIAPLSRDLSELKSHPHNLAALEENLKRGRFFLRVKRRNGRVQEQIEEFVLEQANVKFSPITHGNLVVKGSSNIPQVQFNLQLTEKEHQDRAKVTLPFEHQGNGKEIVKPGQYKAINDEGMPVYQRPFMRGRLYIHFSVDFLESRSLVPEQLKALETVLPPKAMCFMTEVELDECEETTLHDVNIEEEMRGKQMQIIVLNGMIVAASKG